MFNKLSTDNRTAPSPCLASHPTMSRAPIPHLPRVLTEPREGGESSVDS